MSITVKYVLKKVKKNSARDGKSEDTKTVCTSFFDTNRLF